MFILKYHLTVFSKYFKKQPVNSYSLPPSRDVTRAVLSTAPLH